MINIKPQIYELLSSIPDAAVSYFYPQSFATLPAISYYELSNVVKTKADGVEYSSDIQIQIDIYAKTPAEASELAGAVDALMAGKGFTRSLAMDLIDKTMHHKTMRYRGVVCNTTFMVTR